MRPFCKRCRGVAGSKRLDAMEPSCPFPVVSSRNRADTAHMRDGSPKSAAIYVRISHDPSGERLGVQRQEADCLDEAKRRGWSVAQVYVDDDISAFNPKKPRPEYQRLLSDIQLGSRDGVMIWRLDRLHRQPRELEEFIVLCDKHRVALATVTGDVDLPNPQAICGPQYQVVGRRAWFSSRRAWQLRPACLYCPDPWSSSQSAVPA